MVLLSHILDCNGGPAGILEMIQGAGGVLVLGCHPHNCRSLHGSQSARGKAERVRASLEALGMDGQRVAFDSVASNESARLAHILERTIADIDGGEEETS